MHRLRATTQALRFERTRFDLGRWCYERPGLLVLLVAYLLLGESLLVGDGTLPGLPYALAAVALVLLAPASWARPRARTLPWLVALETALVLKGMPGAASVETTLSYLTVLQGAIAVISFWFPRLAGRGMLAFALGVYAVSGAVLITRSPPPRIDVFTLQTEGARALEDGRNPYAATFRNVYTREETRKFFGDERTELSEYPYPPLSLLATTLAHRVAGDVRWAFLVAQLGIGLLLFALARGAGHAEPVALALATLHLLHPRGLFVLQQAWTEPLLVGSFLVVIWLLRQRRARWLGVALGVFVGMKQYSLLALPLVFRDGLRDGSISRRACVEALVVAVAVALPFFVWSPHDFVVDVVLFQVRQPFREDALSIPAYLARRTGWHAPASMAFVGMGAAMAWAWPRLGPRSSPERLVLATAIVYAGFFLFAKQAFCNYYYFVGSLVLAAAALVPATDAADSQRAIAPSMS